VDTVWTNEGPGRNAIPPGGTRTPLAAPGAPFVTRRMELRVQETISFSISAFKQPL